MNRDQKAAVVDRIAGQLESAEAIFAIDYRGLSVKQAVALRSSLTEAGATFQVAKNTLTERAADKAGADSIKSLLEGPTALTFVNGDVAVAAKALATFRRQNGVLEFKGGTLGAEALSIDQIESIARLPARDVLQGQFVGVLASPITGLVRGLGALVGGLALQLGQIAEKGLIGGQDAGAQGAEAEVPVATEAPPEAEAASETEAPAEAEAAPEPAEEEQTSETPSEGETTETEEG